MPLGVCNLLQETLNTCSNHPGNAFRKSLHLADGARNVLDASCSEVRADDSAEGSTLNRRLPADIMSAAFTVSSSLSTSTPTERAQTTGSEVDAYNLCSLSQADMIL
ncbi:hypothetical protein A0H81_13165 [Grifola frondosa]|uniref:Uncharacterized protein n=1 Tax=Grifola frondosa TaxID=5627 RepID=A0A1C7LSB1_GRIFR|nr:hypothetical protein A0H81_13165 [Grifola frondosa]